MSTLHFDRPARPSDAPSSARRLRARERPDAADRPRLLVVVETVSGILEVFAFLTCLSAIQFVETTTMRTEETERVTVTVFEDGAAVFRRERAGERWRDAVMG